MGHVLELDSDGGRPVREVWRRAEVPAGDREEAWRSVVSYTHLPWMLDTVAQAGSDRDGDGRADSSDARIVRCGLGDVDLVECRTGRCRGHRRRSEQRATDGEFIGVLVVRSGHELIRGAVGEVLLGPGDLLAWDSTSTLDFAVSGPLRKQTLLVPRQRFLELTCRPELVTERALTTAPAAALFLHYLDLVSAADLSAESAAAAGNAALELLGAVTAGSATPLRPAGHRDLLRRAKAYAEAHLGERDLAPDWVAREIAVSPRLLYLLFEEEGDAVHAYIRRRRLAHVRACLTRPGPRPTIGQLGARWGFADADALGRAFRAQYDVPPSHARAVRDRDATAPDRAEQAGVHAARAVP